MNFDPKDKKNLPLVTYLGSKSYLVVDTTTMGRSTLRKMLSNTGIDSQKVLLTDNFTEASEKIEKEKPHFIFTSYELGDSRGVNLLSVHKKAFPNRLDTGFFVISETNSLSLAAEMADSDVDGFVAKPYTLGMILEIFLKVVMSKVTPSNYTIKLEEGKELLGKEQYQEALAIFQEAKKLNKSPSLACYYEGMTFKKLNQIPKAQEALEKGLQFDPNHYKCLNELLDTYMSLNNFKGAYKIASTLSQHFPLNPQRIPDLTRLSILNGQFDDILTYSKVFSQTEEIIDDRIRYHVGAGLAICGKHFIKADKIDKAIEALQSAAFLCKDRVPVLVSVISSLLGINKKELADEIFNKLSLENPNPNDPAFKLMELEVKDQAMSAGESIRLAMELKNKGLKEFKVFDVLIQRSIELKRKRDLIEELIKEACEIFPEKKEYFHQFQAQL